MSLSPPVQIFIAYARKDEPYLRELRKHFAPLERDKKVKVWSDQDIETGANWQQSIKNALHKADIIILLLSSDALASAYFNDNELPKALERHRNQEVKLMPILVRACAWELTQIKDIEILPRNKQAISTQPNHDSVYENIVLQIHQMIPNISSQKVIREKERVEQDKIKADLKKAQANLKLAQTNCKKNVGRITEIEKQLKDLQTELREKQSNKYNLERQVQTLEQEVQTLEWKLNHKTIFRNVFI